MFSSWWNDITISASLVKFMTTIGQYIPKSKSHITTWATRLSHPALKSRPSNCNTPGRIWQTATSTVLTKTLKRNSLQTNHGLLSAMSLNERLKTAQGQIQHSTECSEWVHMTDSRQNIIKLPPLHTEQRVNRGSTEGQHVLDRFPIKTLNTDVDNWKFRSTHRFSAENNEG